MLLSLIELHEFIKFAVDVNFCQVSFSFDLVLLEVEAYKWLFALTVETDSFVGGDAIVLVWGGVVSELEQMYRRRGFLPKWLSSLIF